MTSEELEARMLQLEGQNAAIDMARNLLVEVHTGSPGLCRAFLERTERLQSQLLARYVPDDVREAAEQFDHRWVAKSAG